MSSPNLFDYFNYREYLKDYYKHHKETNKFFSYRYFARKANLSTASLLPNIIKGKKNISKNLIPEFTKALGFTAQESDYFILLIHFTHAKTTKAEQTIFEKMVHYLPSKTKRLRENHRDFYMKWYNIAIHQALSVLDINETNYHELKKYISPDISIVYIKQSIKLLLELELIDKNPQGFLKPSQKNLVGGKEVGALYIQNFQKNMLELGKEAIGTIKPEVKHSISETFAVSRECRLHLYQRIADFHKEMVNIIVSDKKKEEEVFQINIQMFPLSHIEEGITE